MDDTSTRWQSPQPGPSEQTQKGAQTMQRLLYEVKRVVVGQDAFLERVLIALLAQGHLLIEGVPGLAKTLTVNTLAKAMQGTFKRIQFTPDLLPSDVVGTRFFNPLKAEFSVQLGPVFAHLVLADEINRAPAKVQSALLEVMQERQVTLAGQTHRVPTPFLVMATQNPIETEGTYPLPEAQVDRFLMKVLVHYPSEEEEFVIAQRFTGTPASVQAMVSPEELMQLQSLCRRGYVDPALVQYAVRLVHASRAPERHGLADLQRWIQFGASPRATIGLVEAARALAFLRGRPYALPQDMIDIVPDVLRHRLVLSYEALAEGITADALVQRLLSALPAPQQGLSADVASVA
jgi:MoxR-like ATPase